MSFLLSVVAGQGGIKVPGAPGTLSLANGTDANTQIDLSWSAPSDTGGGTISGYRIKKDGSVLVADTSSTGTTYTASGLSGGTEYNFNVAAINEKGTGADGNTPTHTTTNVFAYTTTGSPTLTAYTGYESLRWLGDGSLIVSNHASTAIDIFGVAGGGAGGDQTGGGGGGGGGCLTVTGQTLTNTTYTVTVGTGGAGGSVEGGNGTDSVFGSLMTANGGGGGGKALGAGVSGGCGGGGGRLTNHPGGSGNQGGDGGAGLQYNPTYYGGGGGGGCGANGTDATIVGGPGGTGSDNTYFDGSTDKYGGGGGGGGNLGSGTGGSGGGGAANYSNGTPGSDGQGGGGGGTGGSSTGGDGGDGVVIIRWSV